MIGELNHRVKNLLGVVAGNAYQTGKTADSVPAFVEAFGGRLASLGRAHELLTAATWEPAPLRSLIDALTAPYRIAIAWWIESGELAFEWQETGVPMVAAPSKRGFGTRMIERSAVHDLGGTAAFDGAEGGLTVVLRCAGYFEDAET